MTSPVVRLADAKFGYGGTIAAHVDLRIGAGEVVAVLGPNGSGKSTMVKGMLGLIERRAGEVEWFGIPIERWKQRWRVGYVPQREIAASPVPATLEEVVRSGRVAHTGMFGRYRTIDRAAVAEAIRTVALTDHSNVPVRHLSGGQQRRTLVARALSGQPDVLVLDEPFAGVDRDSQYALADTFEHLVGNGVTLIIVMHELGALEQLVTRTVCLDAGEVVFDGSPAHRPVGAHADEDPHGGQHVHGTGRDRRPRLGLLG